MSVDQTKAQRQEDQEEISRLRATLEGMQEETNKLRESDSKMYQVPETVHPRC